MFKLDELNNSTVTTPIPVGEHKMHLKAFRYNTNKDGFVTQAIISIEENYTDIFINLNNDIALINLDAFIAQFGIKSRNVDDINLNAGKEFYVRMESNTAPNGHIFYNARFREKYDPLKNKSTK